MSAYTLRLHRAALGCVLLGGFFIPVSTAAPTVLFGLAWLLLLLGGDYRRQLAVLRGNPAAGLALALFAWMLIGVGYSIATPEAALDMLGKYRELLYIPLLILLLREARQRRWALAAFLAAMLLTLALSYLNAGFNLGIGKGDAANPVVFKSYIAQSILLALSLYFFALFAAREKRRAWKSLWIALALLSAYNVLFLSHGRSGYVLLLALLALLLFQWLRWRGLLLSLLLGGALLGLSYQFSAPLQQRVDAALNNIHNYQSNTRAETSVGLRLEFYQHSARLFLQHPWLGVGTGGFAPAYAAQVAPGQRQTSANPHNEYLLIAVQWGLPGLLLFLSLLFGLFWLSPRLGPAAPFVQGLLLMMAVGSLFNSLLLDFTEGHTFAYLLGVFYAGWGEKESNKSH